MPTWKSFIGIAEAQDAGIRRGIRGAFTSGRGSRGYDIAPTATPSRKSTLRPTT